MPETAKKNSSMEENRRGPVDHARREQILGVAAEHFRTVGYHKTSISDLGRAIGISHAYVYRFFESKQAIGEAVCSQTLARIASAVEKAVESPASASEKIRQIPLVLIEEGVSVFMQDRKLHDIVEEAVKAHWCSASNHDVSIEALILRVVAQGRESGEFERKTSADEVAHSILVAWTPFIHPVLLAERAPEQLREDARIVSSMVLRSLAP
jgi:AcrR family transcriptional regulator